MRQAIKVVFDKTHHRNCRWHILRLWEFELDQLYTQHKDMKLKENLESLINYPLGPMQFEVEWNRLVDECGIVEHPAIKALWEKKGEVDFSLLQGDVLWQNDINTEIGKPEQGAQRWLC
jgi:hypothetical protein